MQNKLLTDHLTGLSNREAVVRRIEDRIRQQRRRGDARPFVVMFADFNRFKSINDRFGHDVGDRVLQELAQRLRDGVRANDLVARYAGDEFVLLIDTVDNRRDAEAIRSHLDATLRQPLAALHGLAPDEPNEGAAIGLALYPDDGQDVDSLLKRADADMYARKTPT
jgi:diguanylate cyclase (GGDEF)-like protein